MTLIGLDLEPDQLVFQKNRDFRWAFENLNAEGNPESFPDGDLYFEFDTGGAHNGRQRVEVTAASGGTYRFQHAGNWTAPIDYYDLTSNPVGMDGDITDALEAVPSIGAGNVKVHPAQLYPEWKIKLTLNAGANEVQHIQMTGADGGTFMLSYKLGNTGILNFGDSAATVQTALEGISDIGAGNVQVTDDGADGYIIEFIGDHAQEDMNIVVPWQWGLGFGLSGPWFTKLIKQTTLVEGSAKISESAVSTLNKTMNDFFDTFEQLAGQSIDFKITDALNMELKIRSLKAFQEADIITFAIDVTANSVEAFFNGVSTFLGAFDTIHVDFFWTHIYEVEFVGDLANTTQAALVSDTAALTGIDNEEEVIVTVLKDGKERYTRWYFSIIDETASLKVESETVNSIPRRTPWQLVFLPDGEASGGDPIARGRVTVQQ